jgi:hypothetical protein
MRLQLCKTLLCEWITAWGKIGSMKRLLEIAVALPCCWVLSRSAVYQDAGVRSSSTEGRALRCHCQREVLSTTQSCRTEQNCAQDNTKAARGQSLRHQGRSGSEVYTWSLITVSAVPNVHYKKWEVCLVFNQNAQRNSRLPTPTTGSTWADDKVAQWKPGSEQLTPFDDAVSEITTAMQKNPSNQHQRAASHAACTTQRPRNAPGNGGG